MERHGDYLLDPELTAKLAREIRQWAREKEGGNDDDED